VPPRNTKWAPGSFIITLLYQEQQQEQQEEEEEELHPVYSYLLKSDDMFVIL
jgi:hypothetical protein